MSAIGETTAVISLGASCQTAWQITRNLALLTTLAGEPLQDSALPFDWLILPPAGLLSALKPGAARFPAGIADLIPGPPQSNGAFLWPEHGFYFWHDFLPQNGANFDAIFENARQKYDYLWRKFDAMARKRRRIFIISNTQNNLDWVSEICSGLDIVFSHRILARLRAALNALFPEGENRLLAVTYKSRFTAGERIADGDGIALIRRDTTRWEGRTEIWARVLAEQWPAPGPNLAQS